MHIAGIELLTKTEIMETIPNKVFLVLMGVALAVALVSFIIAAATDTDYDDPPEILCLISFFAGIFFLLFSLAFPNKVPTGRYEYEVYIGENADVSQLYKNYEFVECRGQIYVFRDSEVENCKDFCCNCDKHFYKNECSHRGNVSPENMNRHDHTCFKENEEPENPKAETFNEPKAPAEGIDNICDNCKSTLEETDKFCSQCGSERKEK